AWSDAKTDPKECRAPRRSGSINSAGAGMADTGGGPAWTGGEPAWTGGTLAWTGGRLVDMDTRPVTVGAGSKAPNAGSSTPPNPGASRPPKAGASRPPKAGASRPPNAGASRADGAPKLGGSYESSNDRSGSSPQRSEAGSAIGRGWGT